LGEKTIQTAVERRKFKPKHPLIMYTHRKLQTYFFLLAMFQTACSSSDLGVDQQEQVAEKTKEETQNELDMMRGDSNEDWTFEISVNEMSQKELSEMAGFNIPEAVDVLPQILIKTTDPLPNRFDWRDTTGIVPPIKNQGDCGSCWAFGACAIAESAYAINGMQQVDISEQWLLDCNTDGWGCHGGIVALSYFINKADACGGIGAVLENEIPYAESIHSCECVDKRLQPLQAWGVVSSPNNPASVETIKRSIRDNGPIIATIDIDLPFVAYRSGIFNSHGLFRIPQSHLVVLTGWDDTQGKKGVWFLRNSFGPMWGEAGTMRIEYGIGGVAKFAASFAEKNSVSQPSCDEETGERETEKSEDVEQSGEGTSGKLNRHDQGATKEEFPNTKSKPRVGGNLNDEVREVTTPNVQDNTPESVGSNEPENNHFDPLLDNERQILDRRILYLDKALEDQALGILPPTKEKPLDLNKLKIDPELIAPDSPKLFGVWQQTDGGVTPDVAPGGYKKSYLLISKSGLLEFVRYYDDFGEVTIVTRLDWQIDEEEFIIGTNPLLQKGRLHKSLRLPIGNKTVLVSCPPDKLPKIEKWKLVGKEESQLVLGKKTYIRLKKQALLNTPISPADK
jgi:C1A family cysteine protease